MGRGSLSLTQLETFRPDASPRGADEKSLSAANKQVNRFACHSAKSD
jgi:hypothetical protein